jgi:hypothetical protein
MSESFWKSDVLEEAQPDQAVTEEKAETVAESGENSGDVALSVDEFSALEERILRTVNLVKQERQARADAEERAVKAELQLREQAPLAENLQKEVSALRGERDNVRQRVEKLLSQLDALEL